MADLASINKLMKYFRDEKRKRVDEKCPSVCYGISTIICKEKSISNRFDKKKST